MQNEIELKIMLLPKNISLILNWIEQQKIIENGTLQLGNTYYDSADHYFARHKMGLRVRSQNHQHEITLKMKGEIVGGMHIRPEYNLALPNNQPDFHKLVSHYQLQFEDNSILTETLLPTFSTDFERDYWLIGYQDAQIEIALDQGEIKNTFGREAICEMELELKKGKIGDIFALLENLPKMDGIWFSSLSKAQRGYLVGNQAAFAKNLAELTACCEQNSENLSDIDYYQRVQQLADFIRLTQDQHLISLYQNLTKEKWQSVENLLSFAYFSQNLQQMKKRYSN